MFFFVISIIAAVVFLITLSITLLTTRSDDKAFAGLITAIAAVVALASFLFSCVAIVPANSVGIPVRFGEVGESLDSGLHWVGPFTGVSTFSTRLQESVMSGDPTEGDRQVDDAIDVISLGGGLLNMDVAVRYRVDPEQAPQLYLTIGNMEQIRDRIVRPDTRTVVREVYAGYEPLDIYGPNRGETSNVVQEALAARLARNGIVLESFSVRAIRLDPLLQERLNAELAAIAEAEVVLAQRETAITAAETARQTAELAAEAAVITAQGEADANEVLAESLTPEVLEALRLEAIVQAGQAGNVIILDAEGTPLIQVPTG